jgi:hypothetical protein
VGTVATLTMTNLQEQCNKLEGLVNSQIDPTSGLAINCRNCIHCEISSLGADFDKCLKCGGTYCDSVHIFPALYGKLCNCHSSWAPRQKTIFELIGDRIRNLLQ